MSDWLQPFMPQSKYNAIINTSQLVNIDSSNSKNVVKVFERVPHVISLGKPRQLPANLDLL